MTPTTSDRQRWFAVLARSGADKVLEMSQGKFNDEEFHIVKAPESGMVQIRGRAGGNGDAFNMGDMTVTRCIVRGPDDHYGHAVLAGRSKDYALCVAQIDALLQNPGRHRDCYDSIISPLQAWLETQEAERQARVSETQVNFFTLVRGEN